MGRNTKTGVSTINWTEKLDEILTQCYLKVRNEGVRSNGEGGIQGVAWRSVANLFSRATKSVCEVNQMKTHWGILKKRLKAYQKLAEMSGSGGEPPFFPDDWDGWDGALAFSTEMKNIKRMRAPWELYPLLKEAFGPQVNCAFLEMQMKKLHHVLDIPQPMGSISDVPAASAPSPVSDHNPPSMSPVSGSQKRRLSAEEDCDSLLSPEQVRQLEKNRRRRERVAESRGDRSCNMQVQGWIKMDVQMQGEQDAFNDWLYDVCERNEVSMDCVVECWKMPPDQRRWLMKFPEEKRKGMLPGYVQLRMDSC